MNKQLVILGLATMVAIAASKSNAQPYYIAGGGVTPSWTPGTASLQLTGSPLSLSTGTGTAGSFSEFKVTGTTWGDPNYPSSNAKIKADANGTNTFHFYPGVIVDGWNPTANRVGWEDPGGVSWELAGEFNGWSGGAGWALNSIGGGVYSNTIVFPTAGTYQGKFRLQGSWDISIGSDFGNSAGNITFVISNSPQSLPVQLDLPNGRWLVGNLAPGPVTNQVVFAVDMSSQILLGKFDPSVDGVFVSGGFNGWPGIGTGVLVLTNYPTYNGGSNTNIYYATNQFIGTPGTAGSDYKFTCNNPADSGSSGYEPRASNRSFNLLSTNGTLLLAVASFGDVYTSDYLSAPASVTFTVNMNGAHGTYTNTFDGSMAVYLTGDFDDNGWAPSPWTPPHMRAMTETSPGSGIYTYTHSVQAGKAVVMHYKYGFDDGVNPLDNEAPAYQDHSRVIRLTAGGSYTLPQDTFGNQHVEPNFNVVSVTPAGANMTVKWLGRPGVMLQNASSITGSWSTSTNTDGAVWAGSTVSTSDGTACTTNVPMSATGFFRMIKPN